jgi:acetyltransferase-like isoleucine patch superfamily enzyme
LHRLYAVRKNVEVGEQFQVGLGSVLWAPRRLRIGDDVYIGKGCTIQVDGAIGDGVLIANRVGIIGRTDHAMRQIGTPVRRAAWVGDHPETLSSPVDIGDDVWIGYGAVILSGVRIGRGAVVAAGAVVTSDVEPYDVVAGNPARRVSRRFEDEAIVLHERRLGRGKEQAAGAYGQALSHPPQPLAGRDQAGSARTPC